MDVNLYDRCSREYNEKIKAKATERESAAAKWQSILQLATINGISVPKN